LLEEPYKGTDIKTDLPVLGLTLKHHGVLVLGEVVIIILLGLLDGVLSLDALILRESALVTLL
jgi:hypothetical protein